MVVDFADVEAATDAFIVKWQDVETNYQTYRATAVKAASAYILATGFRGVCGNL